ncbi:hypothetical protein ACFQZI_03270 [Mucilaginibacter lutimaris]|uniref:UDP-2,4-diacetamido-2,4, 6-trideoxy-beta-L-altropyranose hydrolase n=1 Tax=Mucilaginibacter lutimaris TaxID=931629 RepID=A0ABW2ZBM4_9SPHI
MNRMLFRVDANKTIGRGHLSRTLALAEMFKDDFEVSFLIAAENKDYCAPLLADWHTQYIQDDAHLRTLLTRQDNLWIDGYNFTKEWVAAIKSFVASVIEISDLPQDVYGGDVIVNHCPGISSESYKGINPKTYLLGLKYAMLRPAFLEAAQQTTSVDLLGEGVFICFGGADPLGIGYNFADELLKSGFSSPIYFVAATKDVSFKNYHPQQNITVLHNLNQNQMMQYMQASKVVVVPTSTLSFEAVALRKPIFAAYYVDNQQFIYTGLTQMGLVCGAGYVQKHNDILNMIKPFNQFYTDMVKQTEMVTKQIEALDGRSKQRFNAAIKNLSLVA